MSIRKNEYSLLYLYFEEKITPLIERDSSVKIERYADWLDTKFRIPGTKIRFGFDFLIGLFPVFGDVVGFGLSGSLLIMMVNKGASGRALAKMILNIVLDYTIGSIPILGNLFDLFFKANKRNLNLYQDHFEKGAHQGSAWPVIFGVFAVLIGVVSLILWITIRIFYYLLDQLGVL